VKSSLLDLGAYPPNENHVLDAASPFPEKPAWPTDEESMRSCAEYSVRYMTDPTDDSRPNVRGTDGPDVLVPVPAGQVANPATLTPAGSPDGATIFNAGGGDDLVLGSPGADTVLGGDGNDRIDGGPGNDGSLEGEAGDDRIRGGPGNDLIFGRAGNDVLFGDADDDYLEGGGGSDVLIGGGGADRLIGGLDSDRLRGGPGNDELLAYDGTRDYVDCGPGLDTARVDRRDRVVHCERVVRPRARARRARHHAVRS
jgi:hypothetical protein